MGLEVEVPTQKLRKMAPITAISGPGGQISHCVGNKLPTLLRRRAEFSRSHFSDNL
jgi:hypothetical protein